MSTNHSASPFRLDDEGPASGNLIRGEIYSADHKHLADLPCPDIEGDIAREEWESNARLFVAAPDLLDALNDVLALIHKAGLPWNKSRVLTKARAAIAKATQP